MNKIFKVIWNPATGSYTVASETAKSRGKKSGRSKLLISALVAGGLLSSLAYGQTPGMTTVRVLEQAQAGLLLVKAQRQPPIQIVMVPVLRSVINLTPRESGVPLLVHLPVHLVILQWPSVLMPFQPVNEVLLWVHHQAHSVSIQ